MSDLFIVFCPKCEPKKVIGCKLIGNANQNWSCQACDRKDCSIKNNSGLFPSDMSGICEEHLKEQKNESALLRR